MSECDAITPMNEIVSKCFESGTVHAKTSFVIDYENELHFAELSIKLLNNIDLNVRYRCVGKNGSFS